MKRPVLWIAAAVVIAGIAFGASTWWSGHTRATALLAAIPERPQLSGWPAELEQRIDACEKRIRAGQDEIRNLGELGHLYHANGFYVEASVCYHGLIAVDPKNPRWPHTFASILAGYGKLEEAADLWRLTVRLAPNYMPARLRLGDTLVKSNALDEAAKVYTEALEIDPRQPYALLGMGRVHLTRGRWDAARAPLEQSAALSGDRLAIDLLPTVYEQLGEHSRALALRGRSKATGSFADTPDPWLDELMLECYDTYRLLVSGGAAKHAGNSRLSQQLLERALKLSPESAPIHFQLGMLYLERKEYSRARPHLEQCTRLAPDMGDGWIHLSILLATIGDRAGSERILTEGIANCPASPGLQLERAHRLAAAGKLEEAIAAYRDSYRLRPEEAAPLFSIAKIYIDTDREDLAMVELRRAIQVEPGFPPALTVLAFQAIRSGDKEGAQEWMGQIRHQPRVTDDVRGQLEAAFRETFGTAP